VYIAPLQENYSEALPTPAWLKRAALRSEKNAGDKGLGKIRSSEGRPFQVVGPTMESAVHDCTALLSGGIGKRDKNFCPRTCAPCYVTNLHLSQYWLDIDWPHTCIQVFSVSIDSRAITVKTHVLPVPDFAWTIKSTIEITITHKISQYADVSFLMRSS